MAFNYEQETKRHYQDSGIVAEYDRAFTDRISWRTLRFHFVAECERAAVAALMRGLPCRKVLDIPCGSGKLAEVLRSSGCDVIAADISEEMLTVARARFGNVEGGQIQFRRGDVENLSRDFERGTADLTICLRLLHRVPDDVRRRMLGEIANVSKYAIVSFGVSSRYHRYRRWLRNLIFRSGAQTNKPNDELCQRPLEQVADDVQPYFRIVRRRWVAPLLSEEILFLLERRE